MRMREMRSNWRALTLPSALIRNLVLVVMCDLMHGALVLPDSTCSDGPPPEWEAALDPASKAFLSPIVFSGKLISLSEDYAGRIATTFRVMRQIKNIGSRSGTVPVNLLPGSHVTLFFVANKDKSWRPQAPYCAVHLNKTQLQILRPVGKYVVYASSPLKSLVNIQLNHERHLIPSSDYSNIHNNSPADHSAIHSSSSSSGSRTATNPSTNNNQQSQHLYINYLSAFAPPDLLSKRTTRAVKRILCNSCAKAPAVRGLRGDFRVESKGRLKLRCKVTGNPFPWIEWFRNGKKLSNKRKGRVSIRNKRKLSLLEVRRVQPALDTGYYECRATNAVAREPAVGRVRVIVTRRPPPTTTRTPVPTPAATLSPATSTFTTTDSRPGLLLPLNEWQARSCPIPEFCLNGGQCTFYESVGEYVCQCADGFKGMRCEMKDLFSAYGS